MSGAIHGVGPQPEPGEDVKPCIPYTFSSSSLRIKKKRKKKKIITAAEAKTKKMTRSVSTSALSSSMASTWNMIPKSKPSSLALSALVTGPAATVVSPVWSPSRRGPNAQFEGREEHKIDLSASARLKNIRKPWETDIHKKHKTEFGDRILREGPSSDGPSRRNRLATNRRSRSLSVATNRRSRSLSVNSLNESPPARRLLFNQNSSGSSSSDSDEDLSSADETNTQQAPSDEIPCIDDGDKTYEKYRQFLASSKKNENDETLSRQSVLLLKKKVGAAPSLNFSYRYSAAADEMLGIGNGDDYFLGDFDDIDASNDKDKDNSVNEHIGEGRCSLKESIAMVEQEENFFTTSVSTPTPTPTPASPLQVSSPQSLSFTTSPSLSSTSSLSLATHSPSPSASTEKGLPVLPFQQPLQEQEEEDLSEQINRSIEEDNSHHKEECTSEKDVDLVDGDSNIQDDQASKMPSMATSQHDDDQEDISNNSEEHTSTDDHLNDCEDWQADPTLCSHPQEATEGCLGDKGRERDETENCTSDEEETSSYEIPLNDENEIESSSSEDCRCEHVVSETLVESRAPWSGSGENNPTRGGVSDDEGDDPSVDESRTSKTYNDDCDHNDLDVDEKGTDDSYIQDGDDPEYPKEDRELLSLLYHIHMR